MSYSQALEGRLKIASILQDPRGRHLLRETFGDAIAEGRGSQGVDDLASSGELFHRMFQGAILGEPFYWAPNMCAMLEGVSPGMPDVDLFDELIPCLAGLFWFSKPLTLPLWDGERCDLAAIGWHRALGHDGAPRLDATFFTNNYPELSMPPFPSNVVGWDVGTSLSQGLRGVDEHGVEVLYRDRFDAMFRYLGASLALMNQRIIVTKTMPTGRSTRKRVATVLEQEAPDVRVVELRHAVYQDRGETDGKPVEWSCQWVVSGHWRQQFYPSTGEHRPIFVLPYIKGPEDKPLRAPADRVFAVVR